MRRIDGRVGSVYVYGVENKDGERGGGGLRSGSLELELEVIAGRESD